MLSQHIQNAWYKRNLLTAVLRPFSWMFCALVFLRRLAYRLHIFRSNRLQVPVIVVGNITVGGVGKTPLVIELANYFKQQGYKPAIVSRGYGGKAKSWPQQVRADSDPYVVGDEPIVIARRTGCPMAVGPDRSRAAKALLTYHQCDLIISDDGLQHYALQRDIEIAVVDGMRRFGNGLCLPAGPLRESVKRLEKIPFVICNGGAVSGNEISMKYQSGKLTSVNDDTCFTDYDQFSKRTVHVVAGIGHPARFFDQIRNQGLNVVEHPFPDHHLYTAEDLRFYDDLAVIMTEKDAVKCRRFNLPNAWYVPVSAELDKTFYDNLSAKVKARHG